jgi:integrase
MGKKTAIKTNKHTVSVEEFRNKIRLRWRYKKERYALTVGDNNKENLVRANLITKQIETDMLKDQLDTSLVKYKQGDLFRPSIIGNQGETSSNPGESYLLDHFKKWLKVLGKSQNTPTYYYMTQTLLERWGDIMLDDVEERFNNERYAPATFNSRKSCLNSFFKWMIRKKYIDENPMDNISSKKVPKKGNRKRKPFSDKELSIILEALKTNQFGPHVVSYTHAQYYPFVKFMAITGVRNAEAIGLKVEKVNFETGFITIDEVFARTRKGTHAAARVWKETKTANSREIPITVELRELLIPLVENKDPKDFVFKTYFGKPINDKNFQNRVFFPVLSKLKIEKRDLYAIRHTFGTRGIEKGMNPIDVAYFMGHSDIETTIKNYTHLRNKPTNLPDL